MKKKLEPGRYLDALVGEKAMDGKWIRFSDADYPDPDEPDNRVHAFLVVRPDDIESFIGGTRGKPNYVLDTGECVRDRFSWVPRYSEKMEDAFQVLDKLGLVLGRVGDQWAAAVSPSCLCGQEVELAPTAPLAICAAALRKAGIR